MKTAAWYAIVRMGTAMFIPREALPKSTRDSARMAREKAKEKQVRMTIDLWGLQQVMVGRDIEGPRPRVYMYISCTAAVEQGFQRLACQERWARAVQAPDHLGPECLKVYTDTRILTEHGY